MPSRRTLVLVVGGLAALVIAITAMALNENITYYLYPTEAVDQRADFPDGERFRLAGLVEVGSLHDDGSDLAFVVTDGGDAVAVILTGPPPPLFAEGVPVLIEGAWEGDVFIADTALIRHDENYEIPEEGGAYTDS